MNAAWPLVPLGEVLTERKEVPFYDDMETGKIPIIGKIGFNDGKIQLRTGFKTRTGMILVRHGDLVVSGINVAKGAIAISESRVPIAGTIHYGAYIPNTEKISTKYLWWLLRSKTFRELLEEYVPGGIKTELKAKRFLPVPVPLPPLIEQHRIVLRIEELAAKVSEAKALKIASGREVNSYMNACLHHVMESLDRTGKFKEVITFNPRSGPSFITSPDGSGIPVLMPSSVTGFGINSQKVEYAVNSDAVSIKDRLIPGDILIARGNKREQVGNAGIVSSECEGWVCANLLMRMQIDTHRVDREFCIYWLRSPQIRAIVRDQMSGTNPNIQKINQQKIFNLPFPTKTSLVDQRRIVEFLDDLQSKVDILKRLQTETAAELDAMLPSILDKAFKGELK